MHLFATPILYYVCPYKDHTQDLVIVYAKPHDASVI